MQRSNLVRATVVLAVLTLLVLTVGRVIAIVALISVIGIPIYFLLAVIPPLFVVCLLALGYLLLLERLGVRSMLAAFALAGGTMLALPALLNALTEREVAGLLAGDRTGPIAPWQGGTLAIFVPPRHTEECGDFCQRALASGAARRFVIARSAKTWPLADLAARGTGYRLEQRGHCEPAKLRDNLREIPVQREAPPAAPALRLAIARGSCLVAEPAAVADADGIVVYSRLSDDALARGRANPFAAPRRVTRLSFFARGDGSNGRHTEAWRQTSVRYTRLYPVLVLSFIHGYGLELDAGFWREQRSAGAPGSGPDIDRLLEQALGMRLELPKADVIAGQDAALEAALERPSSLDGATQALAEDAFTALDASRAQPTPEAIQRALRLLEDPRVATPQYLYRLVSVSFRRADGPRDAVAKALLDRVEAEARASPAGQPEALARERSLRYLAHAVREIPDQDLAPHWERLRVVTEKVETAAIFAAAIRRARLVGRAAQPDLLALIDLQHAARTSVRRDDVRRKARLAALSGLCGMGQEAAPLLPEIEARLRSGVILSQYPKDWHAIANTLAALGGDPGLLREVVRPEHILTHLARDLEEAIERPARRIHCDFKD